MNLTPTDDLDNRVPSFSSLDYLATNFLDARHQALCRIRIRLLLGNELVNELVGPEVGEDAHADGPLHGLPGAGNPAKNKFVNVL